MNFHKLKIILKTHYYQSVLKQKKLLKSLILLCFILFLLCSSLYFLHSSPYLAYFISTIVVQLASNRSISTSKFPMQTCSHICINISLGSTHVRICLMSHLSLHFQQNFHSALETHFQFLHSGSQLASQFLYSLYVWDVSNVNLVSLLKSKNIVFNS